MMTRPLSSLVARARSAAYRATGRRRAWQPASLEALEGRTLLSISSVDPTFNHGRPVVDLGVNAANSTPPTLNSGSAVAVQRDGKIVAVGGIFAPNSLPNATGLAVRRYNSDGTPDRTFGRAGETDIALPAVANGLVDPAATVLIQPDGGIVLAGGIYQVDSSDPDIYRTINVESVVARLTADGTPDPTFGTAGAVVLAADAFQTTRLALQADGKIVLVGLATLPGASTSATALTRLNADGSADAGFHGGTLLTFDPATTGYLARNSVPSGLGITSSGQVRAAWNIQAFAATPGTAADTPSTYEVAVLNSDGTLDATYGTGGLARGTGTIGGVTAQGDLFPVAAIAADGSVLLAGRNLIRLSGLTGAVDPSFPTPTLPLSEAGAIVIQPDGKIVVGGSLDQPGASSFAAVRYTGQGGLDPTFGPGGLVRYAVPAPTPIQFLNTGQLTRINALALTAGGQVVTAGTAQYPNLLVTTFNGVIPNVGTQLVLARLRTTTPVVGDYDRDGRSDIAADLAGLGAFAVRRSTGGDVVQAFGPPGIGKTVPDPGDYDGDGVADVAGYLPDDGVFAYRPSGGGPDVLVRFGSAGAGASIPDPGDYDGDGVTDLAVYLPASGQFAYRPSRGGPDVLVRFGSAGPDASIPAPGDYDGDGVTDLAVYLPARQALAYRPSSGGADVFVSFAGAIAAAGIATPTGPAAALPAPGDYDGDGRTDPTLYLPLRALFVIDLSATATFSTALFGASGAGASIPAPGDYDGDGRTDLAVYLPARAIFAFNPSGGGPDVLQSFGAAGPGQTVPAPSILAAQPASTGTSSGAATSAAATVDIPLTADLIATLTGTPPSRKKLGTPGHA